MQRAKQRLDTAEKKINHPEALPGQFFASTGASLARLERNMTDYLEEKRL